jgi:trimeric autotransporter adhesin
MKTIIISLFFIATVTLNAQVAINTDSAPANASSMLDVSSGNKGILIPRMTLTQRNGISNPATGLLIFQTDNTPGFYYNSGTSGSPAWIKIGTGIGWSITGNSGTTTSNFIGTTDNIPLTFKVNGQLAGKLDQSLHNTSFGSYSLLSIGTGQNNTALGQYALSSIYSANGNTAVGSNALADNAADENTAVGYNALTANNMGINNTAMGAWALSGNMEGQGNTAIGYYSLKNNSSGSHMTAIGERALFS